MKIKIEELKNMLTSAASRFVPVEDAAYFAKYYLKIHFRKSPRMNPLSEAVEDLKIWKKNRDDAVANIVDKESVLIMDFHGLSPSLKLKKVHDELERRAKRNGIAATGLINTSGIITLNLWVDALADRNLIGIAMVNGGTGLAVPFGAKKGFFGTNPMAYAIPTEADAIELDMATTEIPFFELRIAKEKGLFLKPGTAIDRKGLPTIDAACALGDDRAANLLPIGGGFKGYGIMMLIEILAGSLIRSYLSNEQKTGWNPEEYGCMIIAIDIGSFTDTAVFKKEVSAMVSALRAMDPADGVDSVPVPGDRGHLKLKQAMDRGEVEVDEAMIEGLRQMTKGLG